MVQTNGNGHNGGGPDGHKPEEREEREHAHGPLARVREMFNLQSPRYAHITGWGMRVPDQVITNADLEAVVDTTDEWIRSRTGIWQRRIATERETTSMMGFEAARAALDRADVSPRDLDLIICATSTPENIYPSTASLIQNVLGATRAGAFDLSAACSGFIYALNMASQAIRSGSIDKALVVGSEINSRVLDWNDRGTCVLFGDGAGAVVLEGSDQPGGLLSCVLGSDGSGAGLLGIPTVGATMLPEGRQIGKIHMNGREVFRFAVHVITESVRAALDRAGLTLADVNLIIPHQANQRILTAAARALNISEALFYSNVQDYGNTSAASIPIALAEAEKEGRLKPHDRIVMVGFGGGLTWGSAVVEWQAIEPRTPHGLAFRLAQGRREAQYVAAYWRDRFMKVYRRAEARLRGTPAQHANLRPNDAKKLPEPKRENEPTSEGR